MNELFNNPHWQMTKMTMMTKMMTPTITMFGIDLGVHAVSHGDDDGVMVSNGDNDCDDVCDDVCNGGHGYL